MLSATAHIILVYCCHHFHDNQLKLNVRKCTKWVSDLDGYPANTPNTLTMVVVMVVMMMLVVMLRMAALWTSPVGDLGDDDHVNACDDSVVECWWLNMDCDVIQPIFSDMWWWPWFGAFGRLSPISLFSLDPHTERKYKLTLESNIVSYQRLANLLTCRRQYLDYW